MNEPVKIKVGEEYQAIICNENHTYTRMPDGYIHKCQFVLKSGKKLYCRKRLARQPPIPCPFKHIITISPKEADL
jgi:hypothetical protein